MASIVITSAVLVIYELHVWPNGLRPSQQWPVRTLGSNLFRGMDLWLIFSVLFAVRGVEFGFPSIRNFQMSHRHTHIRIFYLKYRKGLFRSIMEIGQFLYHFNITCTYDFVFFASMEHLFTNLVLVSKCWYWFQFWYLCCRWQANESFVGVLKIYDKDRLTRISAQMRKG
jgi:hypothetical protein